MFEPISESLMQFMEFVILGFFLAVFYEPLRIIRLFKKQGVFFAGIQDFAFLTLAGLISFAYSMELGAGGFRFFYIIGEFLGAAIYFITIGKLISMLSDMIVRGIKMFIRFIKRNIFTPIGRVVKKAYKLLTIRLGKLYNFIVKMFKNVIKGLKMRIKIMYNKKYHSLKKKSGDRQYADNAKNKPKIRAKEQTGIRVQTQKRT